MEESKANRTAVLVACIMLSFIGGAMIYTRAALVPAALQTVYSRENAEERKGLQRGVVIVKEQEDELNTIYLQPWGSKDKSIVALAGRDAVVDSVFYGDTKKVKGFAYGCSVKLYDGTTGDSLGTISVKSVLPSSITSYGPTSTSNFELHPSEKQIIREVKDWIKQ